MAEAVDERDEDDVEEASDAGVDPGKRPRTFKVSGIRILDDGRLSYERGEKFVLLLADGVDQGEAWKAAGGVNKGSSGETLRILVGNPVFKERLAVLEAEKADLEKIGPQGEAMWAAKQAFRAARVAGDVASTLRSAELMARIADKLAGPENSNPSGSTTGDARPVGRPPSEAMASKVDPARVRRQLMEIGVKAPVPIAAEEASA